MSNYTRDRYGLCDEGTALFMILIAVALFAALGYAISQSGRDSGGIDKEKLSLSVARTVQQAGLIEQTINRLKLINKCADTQISFENNIVTGYANASAPSDKSCHVFDAAGGAADFPIPTDGINDASRWIFRTIRIYKVGENQTYCTEATPPCTELIMLLPNITQEACLELNKRINNISSIYTQDTFTIAQATAIKFTGSYSPWSGDLDGTNIDGKLSACTRTTDSPYIFYHTLIAR